MRTVDFSLMKWAFLVWLGLFGLAFVNGAFRELCLEKWTTERRAHHLSTLLAGVLFAGLVQVAWPKAPIDSTAQALSVGIVWLFLTLFAETFVVGQWLLKKGWQRIWDSYDLSRGELWPLLLLWITLLPVLAFWWHGLSL